MGVGAVLDQKDSLVCAIGRDPFGVKGHVRTDVNQERGGRPVALRLALEVLERHTKVLTVAVDKVDIGAGADRAQRRRHEGVGGTEHGL